MLTTYELDTLLKWTEKLHWLKIGDDGIPELYLDNHMMQTFRMCESRGYLDFVEGYKAKGAHLWFLDFGIAVHKMIEYYYVHRKDQNFDVLEWAGKLSREVWMKLDIDTYYAKGKPWHHKNYETLGGWLGFSALLLQYAQHFHIDNERFRVIGAELYFGKGREVLLHDSGTKGAEVAGLRFRLYLSGKIDLLVDDGHNIGPMDHKTTSAFMGKNPIVTYEVHEGMTGYVYAAKALLRHSYDIYSKELTGHPDRLTNKIFMNFIQVKPEANPNERFKRTPLFVTDYQLEQYRKRQISTAARILQLLIYPNLVPTRNTMACTNYMRHICTYHGVHRQNSPDSELVTINSQFDLGPIWDPEDRANDAVVNIEGM